MPVTGLIVLEVYILNSHYTQQIVTFYKELTVLGDNVYSRIKYRGLDV